MQKKQVLGHALLLDEMQRISDNVPPVYAEHLLRFFTSHPIKVHVPRLASFALHGIVTYTMRSGVVRLDGCLPLRMAHLN